MVVCGVRDQDDVITCRSTDPRNPRRINRDRTVGHGLGDVDRNGCRITGQSAGIGDGEAERVGALNLSD